MKQAILLYDGECGFCRWSVDKVLAWDREDRLRAVRVQDAEGDRLLAGMDPSTRLASWHLATPDGHIYSAGAAAAPLMRLLPGGRPLARLLDRFPHLTHRGYRWVARNRDRVGRAVGVACSVAPDRRGRDRRAHRPPDA
jgi:predicted DCC family thiol-disulfide oxidoreductase YuxK